MSAIAELKALYLANHRQRYPSLPEPARTTPRFTDKTANGLTQCIKTFLNLQGCQCERINTMGRPIDNTKIYTDVLGNSRTIGNVTWIPGSATPGSSDLSAVIKGLAVKIEVKIGRDKMSPAQEKYKRAIEAAGGIYVIARNFTEFKSWFEGLQIHIESQITSANVQ